MLDPKRICVFVFGSVFLILPVAPAVVRADAPAVCLIGDHPGIPDSDAETAAMLVCDELRKQGISVSDPVFETDAPDAANAYRLVLRRLGERVIVRLSHESPVGTIITERQLTLANIEEMIPAAPRLVDALVHNKPIDDTVDMETVTEQEARELRKISGESLWNISIFGTFVPGTDIAGESGMEFGWSYETPSYGVGTQFRTTGRSGEKDNYNFFWSSWSIGGRYFFNKRNISPYVGGGLAIVNAETKGAERSRGSFLGLDTVYYEEEDSESDNGLGAYVVVGMEALRLTKSRMNLELRVDRPFFSLPSRDIMPITLGIAFSRDYNPGGCFFLGF